MIVNVINIGGIRTFKTKYQTPVAIVRDREKSAQVPGQGVQSPPGRVQIHGADSVFQRRQLQSQLACVSVLDAAF